MPRSTTSTPLGAAHRSLRGDRASLPRRSLALFVVLFPSRSVLEGTLDEPISGSARFRSGGKKKEDPISGGGVFRSRFRTNGGMRPSGPDGQEEGCVARRGGPGTTCRPTDLLPVAARKGRTVPLTSLPPHCRKRGRRATSDKHVQVLCLCRLQRLPGCLVPSRAFTISDPDKDSEFGWAK